MWKEKDYSYMYYVILLSSPGTDYTNWLRPKFDYNCYKIQLGKIVKAAQQFNYNVKRLPNTLLPCGKKKRKKKTYLVSYHSFYAIDFNPGVSIECSDSNTDFKLRL